MHARHAQYQDDRHGNGLGAEVVVGRIFQNPNLTPMQLKTTIIAVEINIIMTLYTQPHHPRPPHPTQELYSRSEE